MHVNQLFTLSSSQITRALIKNSGNRGLLSCSFRANLLRFKEISCFIIVKIALGCCVNVAIMPNAPFISYSCISYFGHACPKLNIVLISCLTGKCATQNFKTLCNSNL